MNNLALVGLNQTSSESKELADVHFGTDEHCVLQYLNNFPDGFVTEVEIARRADGKTRFNTDPHWAHVTLSRLFELQLLETDGFGRYQMKNSRNDTQPPAKKFMAPQLREILEHSPKHLDLSAYQ